MPTVSTADYLLDQAKRRLKPTPVTIPGMGALERRLKNKQWDQFVLADPPAGSDLKPIQGDAGLPIIGHMIEIFRGGPDFILEIYRKHGPVYFAESPALSSVMALGPDATQAVFTNRNKDFSQRAWDPVIGKHHQKCPRNTLGASRKNARETVMLARHGKWAVDVVSCRNHREVRHGVREGLEGGQGPDSGSGGAGYRLVA